MGHKIPDPPYDYGVGDDCLACHEAGKTPLRVFIRFWDIVTCPGSADPPNGYTFICTQNWEIPCLFEGTIEFGGGLWSCVYWQNIWLVDAWYADIELVRLAPFQNSSFYGAEGACSVDFPTNLNACPGWSGEGGRAHVFTYTDPIIIALTGQYHLVPRDGMLWDKWQVGMDHAIYRLARPQDKTNVMVLLDKEEIVYE